MSLTEEIAINQFGQGVRPTVDLLDQFLQLDEEEKQSRFIDLHYLVRQSALIDSDIEQAIEATSSEAPYTPFVGLNPTRLRFISITLPEADLEKHYKFLLYLFRIAYQRRYKTKSGHSVNWRYWNLADQKLVESILTTHNELVEKIYGNPGFRSEFSSLAKLYNDNNSQQTVGPDTVPSAKNHVNFMNYDDLVTAFINSSGSRRIRAITLLSASLVRALVVTYNLRTEQVRRLVPEIIDRHMRQAYNKGFL